LWACGLSWWQPPTDRPGSGSRRCSHHPYAEESRRRQASPRRGRWRVQRRQSVSAASLPRSKRYGQASWWSRYSACGRLWGSLRGAPAPAGAAPERLPPRRHRAPWGPSPNERGFTPRTSPWAAECRAQMPHPPADRCSNRSSRVRGWEAEKGQSMCLRKSGGNGKITPSSLERPAHARSS
jgi:hypothetical protein